MTILDMKTNPIFVLLLTLLLCIAATPGMRQCICPPQQDAPAITQFVARHLLNDVCSDCGHSEECCANHNDAPLIVLQLTLDVMHASTSLVRALFDFTVPEYSLAESGTNRAPPSCKTFTLVALHCLLLV